MKWALLAVAVIAVLYFIRNRRNRSWRKRPEAGARRQAVRQAVRGLCLPRLGLLDRKARLGRESLAAKSTSAGTLSRRTRRSERRVPVAAYRRGPRLLLRSVSIAT